MYTINNESVQNFQVFCSNHEASFLEILGLSIKCFVINRKIDMEGVDRAQSLNLSLGALVLPDVNF